MIKKAREFAFEEIKKYELPHPIHFEISFNKGEDLAEKLNADIDIVKLGTILMDVKIGEAFNKEKLEEHVEMSKEATKKLLKRFDLPKEVEKKIINCVEAHHKTIPFNCIEAEICCNSDCYRFLSSKGFFVASMYFGKRFSELKDYLHYLESKVDEKWNNLTLDVCKEELKGNYKMFKELLNKAKNNA